MEKSEKYYPRQVIKNSINSDKSGWYYVPLMWSKENCILPL